MTTILLPELPNSQEYEEYISAFFQSGGLYVERNIIDRAQDGSQDVLELDIITTDYRKNPSIIQLHEIKTGGWGFNEIFKIRGWMDYLCIQNSLLIAKNNKENLDFITRKAKGLSIDIAITDDLQNLNSSLYQYVPSEDIDTLDVMTWRYSNWVERLLLEQLTKKKNSEKDKKAYLTLSRYYNEINNGIFFAGNNENRVQRLYDEYNRHPRISAKCGHELVGKSFDYDGEKLPDSVYNDTYYTCKNNIIQISTYIEHRARLTLLKNAVDYILAGSLDEKYHRDQLLPGIWTSRLKELASHKYFELYPVFWQWFLWFFGGFILKDYEDKDYSLLSEKTGLPQNEIPNALNAYNLLFPQKNNEDWFIELRNSNIRLLKLFSVPFMGIGAHMRKIMYTENRTFEELKLTGNKTLKDITKWNDLLVEVLSINQNKL